MIEPDGGDGEGKTQTLLETAPLPVLIGILPRQASNKDANTYLWLAVAGAALPTGFAVAATNFHFARIVSVPVLYGLQFVLTVGSLYAEIVTFRCALRARSFSAAWCALVVSALAAFVYLVLAACGVVAFLISLTGR